MMSAPQAIAIYEAIADTSSQMRDAAQRNDWGCLLELASHYTSLISDLKDNAFDFPLTDGNREYIISLINHALDNSRAIENVAGPHLAQLSGLIGSLRTGRKLSDAYSLSFIGHE
ncbi:MAG: flagellar protein FliT [Proteobacteria bacterium]|nr:flagellar protein FliT [Pseudomonadota bacterium]